MEIEALRQRYRFTVKDFYRMAEEGILGADTRAELIDGDVIEMPPIGPSHATVVTRISTALTRMVEDRAQIRTQLPIHLGEMDEPEPDVCIVKPNDVYYHRHPDASDVLLVIEVSDSSAAYDRIKKGRIYSRAWIPEYWIIDIPASRLEVYRSPGHEGYAEKRELRRDDSVSCMALPDLTIELSEILEP